MSTLMRWLTRLMPASLAKRFGAAGWGEKSPATPGQPRAENLRLWARSGHRCWPGDLVPASSDFLLPEFTLTIPPAQALPPGQQSMLTMSLLQGASRLLVGRQPAGSSGKTLHLLGPAIPLQNSRLFPHPGRYSLVASVASQEVARFSFRIVADAELARLLKVTRVNINAEKRDGQVVPGLRVLRWNEHRAILPSLRIETAVPAPNTLAHCSVHTLQGTVMLGCEEFLLPLARPARDIKLRRMELSLAELRARTKPTRFTLAVYVAGELKAVTPFLLLPADQIANAEGQLTQDAKDLPLDDLEYEQIMNSLALPLPAPVPRKFWR